MLRRAITRAAQSVGSSLITRAAQSVGSSLITRAAQSVASSLITKLPSIRPSLPRLDIKRNRVTSVFENALASTTLSKIATRSAVHYQPVRFMSSVVPAPVEAKPPIGGLKLFYAKLISSQQQRREMGVIPGDIFNAGKALMRQKKIVEGKQMLKRMLLVDPLPGESATYKEAGDILFADNCIEEARLLWQKSTSNSDELTVIYKNAGEKLFAQNNWESALNLWTICADKLDKLEYYRRIGEHLLARGDVANGVEFLEKSAAKNIARVYEQAGNIALKVNKKDEAITYWEKAIKADCKSIDVYLNIGNHYLLKGKLGEAENQYDAALQLSSDEKTRALILNQKGVALFMNATTWQGEDKFYDRKKSSLQYFSEALSLAPTDSVISKNIELVTPLDGEPHYGEPYKYLELESGQPTLMFNAILKELRKNRTEVKTTISRGETDSTFGINSHGDSTFIFGTDTTTKTNYTVPVYANDIAIHELHKLQANWQKAELLSGNTKKLNA